MHPKDDYKGDNEYGRRYHRQSKKRKGLYGMDILKSYQCDRLKYITGDLRK